MMAVCTNLPVDVVRAALTVKRDPKCSLPAKHKNPHDHLAAIYARCGPSGRRCGTRDGCLHYANSWRALTPVLPAAAHARGHPAQEEF
jgi:hypothetical protein